MSKKKKRFCIIEASKEARLKIKSEAAKEGMRMPDYLDKVLLGKKKKGGGEFDFF